MPKHNFMSRVWVLALIVGLMPASWAMGLGDQPLGDARTRESGNMEAVTALPLPPAPDPRPLSPTPPATATRIQLSKTYGKLPLSFEANRGQSAGEVKFLSRGRGYTLFLTSTEAVLALRQGAGDRGSEKTRL